MTIKSRVSSILKEHQRIRQIVISCFNGLKNTVLFVKLLMVNIFVRFFLRHPKYSKRYRIAICGIFKNEALFLKEWVEYHEMIGVEHFYLYNNKSDDNYHEILQPYIDRELVTLIDWPFDQAQMKAYKHFYETYRHETQWVSFLDIDEFFCPRYKENLYEWLKTKDKYPSLLIYWRMFGTSGKLYHNQNDLVINQYNVSWDYLYHCGKCLINTDYDVAKFDSMTHHLTLTKFPILGGLFNITLAPVNQFGVFVYDPYHFHWLYNEAKFSIQINHYWTKAWEVYEKKRRMTDVFFEENPKLNMSYFYEHEYENRGADYTIYRYVMQLKLKLGLYKE